MRNVTRSVAGTLCGLLLWGGAVAQGQALTREGGQPAASKTSGTASDLPCGGSVLLSEDFEAGIPGTWTVIDGDGATPRPEMGLVAGWQGRADYRDSLANKVAVSPSWYTVPGVSDDWLISPAVAIGGNSCLSWKAYSQDPFFKESYEVRIAATPDTAALLAATPLETVTAESGTPHYLSASLLAYAGQTVHIAFRQTSNDKFVLALDDVRVSNVNAIDVGAYAITYGDPDPGDTVTIHIEVANYGSDTITSFTAHYSVAGGPVQTEAITAVSLAPNTTVGFDHDAKYVSDTIDFNYPICAWTTLPNGVADQDADNDTLCATLTVGNPVGRPDPVQAGLAFELFPNPTQGSLRMSLSGNDRGGILEVAVMDAQGRLLRSFTRPAALGEALPIAVDDLAAGLYFVRVSQRGAVATRKFVKE